jgi:hypothetical protein
MAASRIVRKAMDRRQQRKQDSQRKQLLRNLGIVAVIGVGLLLALNYWLGAVAVDADMRRSMRLMSVVSLLLQLAFAAVAALLGRGLLAWARQTQGQGQWPPTGLDWPGNPPPRHGADAARIAGRLRLAGTSVLVVAALLAVWSSWTAWTALA